MEVGLSACGRVFQVCAATEPALQFDSGKLDSSLGAILPAGFSAPKPLDKTLTVSTVSDSIVAVAKRRGSTRHAPR